MFADSNELLAAIQPGESRGSQRRQQLEGVSGIQMLGSHRGSWSPVSGSAEWRMDAGDDLRITAAMEPPASARQALQTNGRLPGDWRWAIDGGQWQLIADVHHLQWSRLPEAFRELERGFSLAGVWPSGAVAPGTLDDDAPDESRVEPATLERIFRELPWDEQSVVRLDDGWELRPRCGSQAVPVLLRIEGPRVRCRRLVLGQLADTDATDAICDQALRFNKELKHARLSYLAGELVAEACVHRELVTGSSLAVVARAVALAERRARTTVEVLRSSPGFAGHYNAVMLTGRGPSDQPDVDAEGNPPKAINNQDQDRHEAAHPGSSHHKKAVEPPHSSTARYHPERVEISE